MKKSDKLEILDGVMTMLNCKEDEVMEEIEALLLMERWLFNECKEPARSEALEWLGKFGYKENE